MKIVGYILLACLLLCGVVFRPHAALAVSLGSKQPQALVAALLEPTP